jgi:hypothetical protein
VCGKERRTHPKYEDYKKAENNGNDSRHKVERMVLGVPTYQRRKRTTTEKLHITVTYFKNEFCFSYLSKPWRYSGRVT